jgi:prepilin peptidase CpaA
MSVVALVWFNAVLVAAAAYDLRTFRIPNTLPILLAAGALIVAFPATPAQALSRLASGGVVSALGLALYLRGLMGGGDLKLLAAAALWIPFSGLASFATLLGLAGALQGLGTLLWVRVVPSSEGVLARGPWREMPYAVSIAAAGLVWSGVRFFSPATA